MWLDLMKDSTSKFLEAVAWAPSLIAAWCFLRQWWAPDACLDFGGSFDYVTWQCSHSKNHPYIEVPPYSYGSLWALIACVTFAVTASVVLRSRRNSSLG